MTERVRIINEKFKTTSLTTYLLKRLYKKHHIKRTKVEVLKSNNSRYPPDVVDKLTRRAAYKLKILINNGFDIW